jgi:hypothetical protein
LEIRANLEKQIPLLPQGIERLLRTQRFRWHIGTVLPLFAQLAATFHLSKTEATNLVKAHEVEPARSLFGLINAVTRAGQGQSNETWFRYDQIGGKLVNYSREDWEAFTNKAVTLTDKEVTASFLAA